MWLPQKRASVGSHLEEENSLKYWLEVIVISVAVDGIFRLGKYLRQKPNAFFFARGLAIGMDVVARLSVVCGALFYANAIGLSRIKQSSVSEIKLINMVAISAIICMFAWSFLPRRLRVRLKAKLPAFVRRPPN
jgi:hypothetical protein